MEIKKIQMFSYSALMREIYYLFHTVDGSVYVGGTSIWVPHLRAPRPIFGLPVTYRCDVHSQLFCELIHEYRPVTFPYLSEEIPEEGVMCRVDGGGLPWREY